MLSRDMLLGLARYRGLAEPFPDPQPRNYTSLAHSGTRHSRSSTSARHDSNDASSCGVLPEDVIVAILRHLAVGEIMVIRRCNKWFKRLTENRFIWLNFLSQTAFSPSGPGLSTDLSTLSIQALEARVRRQFELSRKWSPKSETDTPIRISSTHRLAMPNNESLTAISSMNSWVAVASDLGGIYMCAPFGEGLAKGIKWIRVLSLSAEITMLRVTVWAESEGERAAVFWAGRVVAQGAPLRYQCGVVSAMARDLVAAQSRTQGGILLDSSDFVSSTIFDLRNPASEIMDIAIGGRYCAVVDAAHVIQVFMHRPPENGTAVSPLRSEFGGPARSSRKTISLQFLPYDQLLICSDSFIAVYKPVSRSTTTMESKYWTHVPSTNYFGLLVQHRSSSIIPSSHTSVPILALSIKGTEITHFDLRVACSELDVPEVDDYGLAHRRSVSYLLSPLLQPFSMGTIIGGHFRLVWITSGSGRPFGIALGRIATGNGDPSSSYQAPLNRAALDLGEYGELIRERMPCVSLFVFHEGEGMLLGGVKGAPDLVMVQY